MKNNGSYNQQNSNYLNDLLNMYEIGGYISHIGFHEYLLNSKCSKMSCGCYMRISLIMRYLQNDVQMPKCSLSFSNFVIIIIIVINNIIASHCMLKLATHAV